MVSSGLIQTLSRCQSSLTQILDLPLLAANSIFFLHFRLSFLSALLKMHRPTCFVDKAAFVVDRLDESVPSCSQQHLYFNLPLSVREGIIFWSCSKLEILRSNFSDLLKLVLAQNWCSCLLDSRRPDH